MEKLKTFLGEIEKLIFLKSDPKSFSNNKNASKKRKWVLVKTSHYISRICLLFTEC